ncbi:MAG: UDP-N-acetylglucosamine diphosphorylase [Faecalibacterium sp.]|nr:UDP-N-acetylglucosamine diphosphorylase [Ruminococcus sp.]MCM1391197.1 UDP-N-acetylglucosamine diphosphorylase [Ruminococcus sp.]MCM1485675.1 UDP-N-acetylglucosamine diphosphorylase [Faecalibacterium sp.]
MKQEIINELTSVSDAERDEIINMHKQNGVIIPMANGVFIGKNVKIESGAVILQGSVLIGDTAVGSGAHIGPDTWLYNTEVGACASLNNVQSYDSKVAGGADIGPFVHIRPGSTIGKNVHLGNFVEVKNSNIDEGTKVSHLTYVGDSDVGKGVNFGCGCVTVNYTGKKKFRTTIGDHAFIGCNTNLIAPVTVGDYGYTAAGSTITDDVPENALAIARARQINKENWVLEKKPYKGME